MGIKRRKAESALMQAIDIPRRTLNRAGLGGVSTKHIIGANAACRGYFDPTRLSEPQRAVFAETLADATEHRRLASWCRLLSGCAKGRVEPNDVLHWMAKAAALRGKTGGRAPQVDFLQLVWTQAHRLHHADFGIAAEIAFVVQATWHGIMVKPVPTATEYRRGRCDYFLRAPHANPLCRREELAEVKMMQVQVGRVPSAQGQKHILKDVNHGLRQLEHTRRDVIEQAPRQRWRLPHQAIACYWWAGWRESVERVVVSGRPGHHGVVRRLNRNEEVMAHLIGEMSRMVNGAARVHFGFLDPHTYGPVGSLLPVIG